MTNNTINNFLQLFHNENKIHFRAINGHLHKSFNQFGTYSELQDQLQFYNDSNFDIYFTVNSGGTKQTEINKINAVFIDFDCGRNKQKEYYPIEYVNEYKQKQLQIINQFNYKPSAIIETRNGLHVYWLVNNATIDQFIQCQSLLIQYFNSDPAVKTIERIMRVPGYYWCKDIHNKYKTGIQLINNNTYDINELIGNLSKIITYCENGEKRVNDRISLNNTSLSITQNSRSGNVCVDSIKNGDIELLQAIIKPIPRLLENEGEFYDYITQEINLNEFLGVPSGSFRCIFHDDNNPSAGIFITKNNQYFYKCHSASCGFRGNIIRCVERLRRCNRPQAINFIKQVYKLEVKETEWQQEQKKFLESNKRMILSGEFEEAYPEIHKVVKKYLNVLNVIHDIAIDHVYDEKFSDDNNNVVFFASIPKICRALDMNNVNSKVPNRIGLLAFLLLIKKLNEEQIPEKYLRKAKHHAATYKQKNIVSFYSIPSYSDEHMIKSLERAIMYVENNITMKGWSRELLQRTFGDDIANEIYPYFKHRKLTKKSTIRTEHIHKVTNELINTYGYALEKEILENMVNMYSGMNQNYSKEQLHKQIKRSLQEMLDTYGWVRVRLNNKIKEAYSIQCEGYPFAIVRK
jgi:hypothetical protein